MSFRKLSSLFVQPEEAIDELCEYLRLLKYQAQTNVSIVELDYLKPFFDIAVAEWKLDGLTRRMSLREVNLIQ